jgi:hypothetical protein
MPAGGEGLTGTFRMLKRGVRKSVPTQLTEGNKVVVVSFQAILFCLSYM